MLLIPTVLKNGKTGYEQSIPWKERKMPRKLQLHGKDIARYGIASVDFTAAHFNHNIDG